MILGKLLFGTLQAGTCRELAFGGVVVQHPAAGLQIIDISGIQQLDAAPASCSTTCPPLRRCTRWMARDSLVQN